jgi:hypothetical protein
MAKVVRRDNVLVLAGGIIGTNLTSVSLVTGTLDR